MSDRIRTPFGATSTADDVLRGVDLTGKRAVVTGASSGIGLETARVLAAAGATVTLAVRSVKAGQEAAAAILTSTGKSVLVEPLDLADRASIAAFVARWQGPLHILVDNAGVMATPEQRTPEGWELQFATNHLGHFALTVGLHGALAAAHRARVVVVSSVGHLNGEVLFDDLDFRQQPYDPWKAYSQSKSANILFAVEAAKRWAKDGIAVNALTPGRIRTQLMRHLAAQPAAPAGFQAHNASILYKSVEQGAATSALLAGSPLVEGATGRYFEDVNEAEPQPPGERRGLGAHACDPVKAARLWDLSAARTGSNA